MYLWNSNQYDYHRYLQLVLRILPQLAIELFDVMKKKQDISILPASCHNGIFIHGKGTEYLFLEIIQQHMHVTICHLVIHPITALMTNLIVTSTALEKVMCVTETPPWEKQDAKKNSLNGHAYGADKILDCSAKSRKYLNNYPQNQ